MFVYFDRYRSGSFILTVLKYFIIYISYIFIYSCWWIYELFSDFHYFKKCTVYVFLCRYVSFPLGIHLDKKFLSHQFLEFYLYILLHILIKFKLFIISTFSWKIQESQNFNYLLNITRLPSSTFFLVEILVPLFVYI